MQDKPFALEVLERKRGRDSRLSPIRDKARGVAGSVDPAFDALMGSCMALANASSHKGLNE